MTPHAPRRGAPVVGRDRRPAVTALAVPAPSSGAGTLLFQPTAAIPAVEQTTEQRLLEAAKEQVDSKRLLDMSPPEQAEYVRSVVSAAASQPGLAVGATAEREIAEKLAAQMVGWGVLQPFLNDPGVTEIKVIGTRPIWLERGGRMEPTSVRFESEEELLRIAARMAEAGSRQVNRERPLCDTRLPDGSRVNIAVSPISLFGTTISIRKHTHNQMSLRDLIALGTVDETWARFLDFIVRVRANTIVSGGTGSGKTTTLNILLRSIGQTEVLVTLEDTAELEVDLPLAVGLETRPKLSDAGSDTEITMTMLLKNALRMRPDRIVVGEVRGVEIRDLLQAMNTGHDGSVGTIHANSPEECIGRAETMYLMAGTVPQVVIVRNICSVDVIIQVERCLDGVRRIVSIVEVSGYSVADGSPQVKLSPIMTWQTDGAIDRDGKLIGNWVYSGVVPEKLRERARRVGRDAELLGILNSARRA
jgi:pilus assembly protein CpaF